MPLSADEVRDDWELLIGAGGGVPGDVGGGSRLGDRWVPPKTTLGATSPLGVVVGRDRTSILEMGRSPVKLPYYLSENCALGRSFPKHKGVPPGVHDGPFGLWAPLEAATSASIRL